MDSKLRNQLAKFSQNHLATCETGIFMPTLFLLIFLCLNFHFLLVFSHSCNSLARKYPRKGKLPSYINSLVNTKKEALGSLFSGHQIDQYIDISYIESTNRALALFFIYIFIFSLFFFLAN